MSGSQQQQAKFDEMYYAICNETGGIHGLLDSLFSFMYRRTDFFYECEPGDKMGFPPGKAEIIVNQAFKYYQDMHYKNRQPPKDIKEFEEKLKVYQEKMKQQKEMQEKMQAEKQKQLEVQKQKKQEEQKKLQQSDNDKKQQQEQQDKKDKQEQQQQGQKEEKKDDVQQIQEEKDESEIVKEMVKQSNFNTYNGGKTDKYSWTQSISDVTVEVILPKKVKSKQLKVDLENQQVRIEIDGKMYIQGSYYMPIKTDDSLWSLEDGNKLILTLEKAQENIWKTVLKGDQEIDTKKVENTKPIDSFDGETQGAIRKLMYDQKRKQMGLPTSEQEAQLEMMKKAWDAEGSPFKGQPFDPSKLNFDQSQFQQ